MKLRPLLRRRLAIPVLCYLVALVAWILWGAAALGADLLARNSGRLAEQTLHAGNFALVDLELKESALQEGEPETLLTLTGDPQMILEDVSDRTVRTLQVFAEYEGDAREMCLYYTTEAGQPYSQDRRVYPALQADGSYLYTLPRTRIVALRLDPCSPDEGKQVTIRLDRITFNTQVGGYFLPSWYQIFCLVLYPALAAAALDWLRAVLLAWRRPRPEPTRAAGP